MRQLGLTKGQDVASLSVVNVEQEGGQALADF